LGKGRSFVLSPKAMISKTGGRNVHPPPIDRDKAMNKSDAIKILNDYNKWRRGGDDEALMPEPFDIGLAIDAAVKFLGDDGWMPIDTAPKDGTPVDLFCIDANEAQGYLYRRPDCYWTTLTKWNGVEYEGWAKMESPYAKYVPKYWMPLLPQPKEKK